MGAIPGSVIDENNIVCSDVGGSSMPAVSPPVSCRSPASPRSGHVRQRADIINSIGAGTGTYIRIDPATSRIKLGPDSAGGTPGPTFTDAGNTTPTINDANLLLGILNEKNYLGGKVRVNKEVSYRLFKEKVADPLGLDVYDACETCIDLLNVIMREHLVRSLMVGRDLRDNVLLGYCGGGLHRCPMPETIPTRR